MAQENRSSAPPCYLATTTFIFHGPREQSLWSKISIYWHLFAQPLVQAAFTRGGVEGQALLQVCLHPLPPLLDFGFWRWFWRWFPFPVLRRFEFWRVFPAAPLFLFLRRFEFWRLFCLFAWFLRSKNEKKFNNRIGATTYIIDFFLYRYLFLTHFIF